MANYTLRNSSICCNKYAGMVQTLSVGQQWRYWWIWWSDTIWVGSHTALSARLWIR